MDIDEAIFILERGADPWCSSVSPAQFRAVLEHVRKLAEREKALTEALEALVAERGGGKKHCGHEYDCICTRDLVRAALALHKEDA